VPTQTDAVRVIRVITDDLKHRFWVAATPPEEAITRILNDVPEGWSAALLDVSLTTTELALLKLQSGEIRELKDWCLD
jgi:hypothetical protein